MVLLTKEDLDLIACIESKEASLDSLRSHSFRSYGEFRFETLSVDFHFSDEEVDRIFEMIGEFEKNGGTQFSKSDLNSYYQFIQAWAHEYCHFLQALTINACSAYAMIRRSKLKLDTVILFKFLEAGGQFILGTDKRIQNVLSRFQILESDRDEIKNINSAYDFYLDLWRTEVDGISAMHIVEGMAHTFSLHMIAPPHNNDPLELTDDIYIKAYAKFKEESGVVVAELSWERIIFCYICYFSMAVDGNSDDRTSLSIIPMTFFTLSRNCKKYLDKMITRNDFLEELSELEIENLFSDILQPEDLAKLSQKARTCFLSFVEVIHLMQQDVDCVNSTLEYAAVFHRSPDLEALISAISKKFPLFQSNYCLLILMTFPAKFFDLTSKRKHLDKVEYELGEKETSHENESEFYKLILNFKLILDNTSGDPYCCEKHGYSTGPRSIKCRRPGSIAATFSDLLGKPISEMITI